MRILFITSTRIGDAVLSSGLIGHLIESHPDARFTIACGPLAADLFRDVPGLDRLIPLPKRTAGLHWVELWLKTAAFRWDLVVDLRSSAIAWLLLAKMRRVARRWPGHRVAAAAKTLGLDQTVPPCIFVAETRRAAARRLVGDGPVLALGPTANWRGKQWPEERFAELAERLTAAGAPLAGARILILGAAEERPRIARLLSSLPAGRLLDQMGRLDLLTAYACLERSSLYVGNDSGLMHLAAAAGAPTLGLFGPSDEGLYGPWGPNARSVRGPESFASMLARGIGLSGGECHMLGLSVDAAERAALDLLAAATHP